MANTNLSQAKKAKNDEFYTQLPDIQKEIQAYLDFDPDTFRGKVVYCNCDDPLESNFFKYFVLKFNDLGLKRLITTSYKPSPVANTLFDLTPYEASDAPKFRPKDSANRFIIDEVGDDINHDGITDLHDVHEKLRANKHNEWTPLRGDDEYSAGDFRSKECVELLKQADIVVTNPPFSLFREYVGQLIENGKKFIIVGNMGAAMYKEIFSLIMSNKIWLGNGFSKGNAYFAIPSEQRSDYANGVYNEQTGLVKFRNVHWFTNLDHGRRHQPLQLRDMSSIFKRPKHSIFIERAEFEHYDNYDAIEVPFTDSIPSDYSGVMGVPVSFLDKYSPEQFEIMGMCENEDLYSLKTKRYTSTECKDAYFVKFGKKGTYDLNASGVVRRDNKLEKVFSRILIKHRKAVS